MTLPASFPLSMSQIAAELNRSLPLSLLDQWVQYLANSAPPISMSQLLGKTGRFDGNRIGQTAGGLYIDLSGQPFFNGTLTTLQVDLSGGGTQLTCGPNSSWPGNVLVRNNTTGVQLVLNKIFNVPAVWNSSSNPVNLIRNGITDNFTIVPTN
jgi:hypothetical protein